MRTPPSVTLLVSLIALAAASCSGSGPQFPSVPDEIVAVAGVAWHDDNGNGIIDPDEPSATDLQVDLGIWNQRLSAVEAAVTGPRGGFVLEVPESIGDIDADIFAQVTLQVPGPAGGTIDVHIRRVADIGSRDVEIAIPTISGCALEPDAGAEGQPPVEVCGTLRLPDLVPLLGDFGQPPTYPVGPESVYVDTETEPGAALLRLASATANIGDGPLHMIPGPDSGTGQTPTWQRLWTVDNHYTDVPTGEFVFHPDHDHFHLNNFEQYRLLTLDEHVLATGNKISFCLIDTLEASPEAQTRGFGIFQEILCRAAGQQQALNPGWADYYGSGLADQWIDITGIEPGDYRVELIIDPDDLLLESDETNNRATFPVTITAEDLARS